MIFRNQFKSIKGTKFGDYISGKAIEVHPYYEAMCAAKIVSDKTIFISGGVSGTNAKKLKKLAQKALDMNYKVTMSFGWKKEFPKKKNIEFFKDNTKEYYTALLSSKYVYAGSSLTCYYNKPKGQFLAVDLADRDRDKVAARIVMDFMYPEADLIVPDNDSDREKVWENILNGKVKEERISDNKPKILIVVNTKYYFTFELARKMLTQVDYDKYDVTMLIPNSSVSKYQTQLSLIDNRAHLLVYKGSPLCNEKQAKRLNYVNAAKAFGYSLKKIDQFVDSKVFELECKRVLRSTEFDYVYNLAYNSVDYRLFMYHVKGHKILLSFDDYSKENSYEGREKAQRDYLKMYSEIWMKNDTLLEAAKNYDAQTFNKKGRLIPEFKRDLCYPKHGLIGKEFTRNNEKYLITDYFRGECLDAVSIVSVLVPKDKYSYIVPGHIKSDKKIEFLEWLRKQLHEKKTIYIFDYFGVLSEGDIDNMKYDGTIVRHDGYSSYCYLKSYLGEEIKVDISFLCSEDKKTIFE